MKRFSQIAFLVAILGFGNVANAEQSGGFLGLEVGYGSIVVPFDYELKNNNAVNQKIAGNFNGDGVAFGFIGGYKQFFNPYFGLRYHANINVVMAKVSPKVTENVGNIILDAGDNRSATLVNYGANVDMLVNFIVREKNKVADFGAFLGLSLGGSNWSGQAINDIDDYIIKREQFLQGNSLGWKTARNFFDFSLNVGLRTNIKVNHGLELAVRVPLVKNEFLNKQKTFNGTNVTFKVHTKNQTNITLRYVYSFGKATKIVRKIIKRKVKKPQSESSGIESQINGQNDI